MEFFDTNSYIRKTRPEHFIIGDRPLDPLLKISGKRLLVDEIITATGRIDWASGYLFEATSGIFSYSSIDELFARTGNYNYITGDRLSAGTGIFDKVGIGTTDPQSTLHIVGDTILSGYLYDSVNSTGIDGYVLTSKEDGPRWLMIEDVLAGLGGDGTTHYISKWEDPDTLTDSIIYEDPAGKIGVGTSFPDHKLHVAGGALISGDLMISGNATTSLSPTEYQHLTTKLYVDDADLVLSGNLTNTGIHLHDHIEALSGNLTDTGVNLQGQINELFGASGQVYHWEEAFEIDSNGEVTPTAGEFISDTMWILNKDEGGLNLELRANLWRYNQGTAAVLIKDENGDIVIEEADDFPEDVSF